MNTTQPQYSTTVGQNCPSAKAQCCSRAPLCLYFSSSVLRGRSRFLGAMIQAKATAAVPSPLCREKHKNVAHRNAEQPMNAVLR